MKEVIAKINEVVAALQADLAKAAEGNKAAVYSGLFLRQILLHPFWKNVGGLCQGTKKPSQPGGGEGNIQKANLTAPGTWTGR